MGRALLPVTLRALGVLALAAMVALALWRLAATSSAELSRRVLADGPLSLTKLPFDEALIGICSVALVVCGGWQVLVTALLVTQVVVHKAVVESAGGSRSPHQFLRSTALAGEKVTARMCPRLTHRIVLAGCGVALATGLASPAAADQAGRGGPVTAVPEVRLGGLVMPDRTVGPHVREPRPARITVTPGASLWSIAKAALPDQAGNAEITAAWHAMHRANADRIGNDPDLIFPGTTLQIPDLNEPDRKDHQ